jgi:hypothetical protein
MDQRHCLIVLALSLATFATVVQVTSIIRGRNVEMSSTMLCLNAITYACCLAAW